MVAILDALAQAFKSLFSLRMIWLMVWPVLLSLVFWGVLAILFWTPITGLMTQLLAALHLETWLAGVEPAWVAAGLHALLIVLALGPVSANFAPALLRESDGCKARRAGKGHPLPSGATQQTRFLAATLRDGPAEIETAEAHPFVASRLQCPHCGASRFAGCIPNRPRRRRELSVNRP